MKSFKKWINLALAVCIAFSLTGGFTAARVQAQEPETEAQTETVVYQKPKLMQSFVTDNMVRAYIRNGVVDGTSTYQIGRIPCTDIRACGIGEDPSPVRTLILLDNSLSMTKPLMEPIKDTIRQIIETHGENELFRIGTFDEQVHYLTSDFTSDYLALDKLVEGIEYKNQDTYLSTILYDIISEIDAHDYTGYVRIILFADGVKDEEVGYTNGDMAELLAQRNYPIYSFGVKSGNNGSLLEDMFALSRKTGAEYLLIDKDNIGEVPGILTADQGITAFTATIAEEAKDGSRKNSQLTLADGSTVNFEVQVPFSIEVPEPPTPDPPIEIPDPPEPEPTIWDRLKEPKVIGAIAGAALIIFALIWLLIYNLVLKNKKKPQEMIMPTVNLNAGPGETELFGYGTGAQNNGTEQLTPSVSDGRKRYMFLLTDKDDEDRSFRCELVDEVTIGRMEDNHIIIGDDNSVHRHHSVVSAKNGTFYYTDLKDVKNRSAVNGVLLKPTIPQLIVNNSIVTIGRHSYTITIMEGH